MTAVKGYMETKRDFVIYKVFTDRNIQSVITVISKLKLPELRPWKKMRPWLGKKLCSPY